ncbi:MAG: MBL fold metallo-hydrolase [Actinobacteria bacterium]|nr:MBL fold metallo-hydrolase [Actinomycetota bacterium]
MDARIDRVVTGDWADRNAWVIGDDDEVIVVDPGRDAQVVLDAVGDREIIAVICTHGHADHVEAALEVAERDEALVALHPKDRLIWSEVHDDSLPDIDMEEGGAFEVAGVTLEVLNTPGHTPGSVSIYCEDLGVVFSGDALSADGPCPHDGAFPDFAGQLSAIGAELLPLPVTTRVLPGHGEESTIAQAESRFDSWFATRPKISGDADD